MECGNTEAAGFICRFHLATEKHAAKNGFSRGGTSSVLQRQRKPAASVLPQGKAMNVACATVSSHSTRAASHPETSLHPLLDQKNPKILTFFKYFSFFWSKKVVKFRK
ncbi:MAG: hypothetical protein K6C40_08780, partial [Thermoguttaceae bacterium]|nr:hypothetical protein [Thermoguttaceae bacterium]